MDTYMYRWTDMYIYCYFYGKLRSFCGAKGVNAKRSRKKIKWTPFSKLAIIIFFFFNLLSFYYNFPSFLYSYTHSQFLLFYFNCKGQPETLIKTSFRMQVDHACTHFTLHPILEVCLGKPLELLPCRTRPPWQSRLCLIVVAVVNRCLRAMEPIQPRLKSFHPSFPLFPPYLSP